LYPWTISTLTSFVDFLPPSGNGQDASGHGYPGQVCGSTLTGAGYQGQAYFFNGTDSYI
jgi:hypothetical protein